jgi:hypothetical protein
MWTAARKGAISNSTATARSCSTARAPPTFPQATKLMGLRFHSTNVWSIAFLSTPV